MTAHLLYLDGGTRAFRCRCKANVFIYAPPHKGYEVFACNACGAEYASERKIPERADNWVI